LELRIGVGKEKVIIHAGDKINAFKQNNGADDGKANENPCLFAQWWGIKMFHHGHLSENQKGVKSSR
jgi:hypothetical protein